MSALWPILWKETLHIVRDPRSLLASLLLPLLMLILFGYAIRLDVRGVQIGVVDYDHTPASRAVVDELCADGAVSVVARPGSEAELAHLIRAGSVPIGLILPLGLGADRAAGRSTPVQLLVDGTNASFAGLALGQVGGSIRTSVTSDVRVALTQLGGGSALPGLHTEPRVFYNEALNSTWFTIPGLIAVIIMMLAAMVTSQCVAREYEHNTIEQLLVSPVPGAALMVGKLLPYIVLGVIQVLSVTLAAKLLFQVPIRGSLGLLSIATLLYLTGSMSLGLMLSAVFKSQQVAMQVAFVATILPSLMLSGFMFPITNMPVPMQVISTIVPARYYIHITRVLFLKGAGVDAIWTDLVAMTLYASVLLIVATSRFRRSLS